MDSVAPCAVRRVVVHGVQHTHESVVQQELYEIRAARTLGAIGSSCCRAAVNLRSLDIFDACDVLCDAAPGQSPDGLPLADIVVTVREKKRLTSASTGVHTQSGEGSVDGSLSVRNLLGRAERLELNGEMGQQKSNSFRALLVKPRFLGRDATISAELSKQQVSQVKRSSFMQKDRTARVSCQVGSADGPTGAHELTCELSLRDVCKLPPGEASWAIVQQRGTSLKSALRHSFSLASLDDALTPSSGYSVKLVNEIAGLPPLGDVRYRKHSVHASLFAPLLPRGLLTLALQGQAGFLLPLSGSSYRAGTAQGAAGASCICDRFFLGGPGSFWGFRTNGLGPRDDRHPPCTTPPTSSAAAAPPPYSSGRASARPPPRDALGGDVMGIATASLSAPLPGRFKAMGARGQVFASAGGLQTLGGLQAAIDGHAQRAAAVGDSVTQRGCVANALLDAMRACVGIGIAVPTTLGRVELNLTHVLRRQPNDSVQRSGWQIGMSAGLS